ncbi:M20 family metallopeptidase [Promethearchaeum syntrophicum]|uniref:M20 family metallopeptidase n=1 Tax=Promethearchaeum syntrophicum TaxID=2594042 RepID=A0A5B9D9Y9_9ARCH|nr:amidohydrolase [Candidatus Prometheoarchaeum syntrophicum]QEE15913.1 Thermostable carboxypeptidase 1 [Candidatus Prometheoarchaeum syntrophicum]
MHREKLLEMIINEAHDCESYLIEMRRYFHMHPETMYDEENTASYIEKELTNIGFSPVRVAGTGITAILKGNNKGKTIGLRADMDALNITEKNEKSYVSKIPGKMHACGHDAHMACLLGAARILWKFKDNLIGNVKFIFQPAEEGGAGAYKMINEGVLDDVDEIFGLHVWSPLESGKIGLCPGPIMASSDMFEITIKGKGGHAAFPHLCIDPSAIVPDIYDAFQKILTREIDPLEPTVISIPVFKGSNAHNVIPSKFTLQGTIRTLNPTIRKYIIKRMHEVLKGYAEAWRCKAKLKFIEPSYPTVINDEELTEKISELLDPLGPITSIPPSMGGEDFSFFQQKVRGVFLFLGIKNIEKGILNPHHHPNFDIDEDILWKGAAIYSILGFKNFNVDF